MLELFQLTAAGEVFFRVGTENGLMEIGSPGLPSAPKPLRTGVPQFYDAIYFDRRVRVGSYARELTRKAGASSAPTGRIVIQVAESLNSRSDFTNALLMQAARRDVLLLLAAGILLAAVLSVTLKPLARLRDEVSLRSPLDLTPIDAATVPIDVRPLVDAINLHMARTEQVLETRRRFVDDASHQLRTPLATLRMQFDYVLREKDSANVRQALLAISRQLNQATRRTNQMLALARADAVSLPAVRIELGQFARKVANEMVLPAREKRIDLELEGDDAPVFFEGHADLLREAALNLLHNAIRFTSEHGRIVVRVSSTAESAVLSVIDEGPGIPESELPRMGERFFRASNAAIEGAGLGLAIARAILERHGGTLSVENRPQGMGCVTSLVLPHSVPASAA
jgi:two-component system sensor histidine kinase TctE